MPQIRNPETFECSQCTNEIFFKLIDIDRIGETQEFDALIQCQYCLVCVNYRFTKFAMPDKLIRHIKYIMGEQVEKQRPTSYEEYDLRTGRVVRTTHKDGLWEDLSDGYYNKNIK